MSICDGNVYKWLPLTIECCFELIEWVDYVVLGVDLLISK